MVSLRTAAIFVVCFVIYLVSGCWQQTHFNAHVYLADAMLHGHFWFPNPGWFEMAPYQGRTYIAYGIGPTLLMLPFVAIWHLGFPQSIFNVALAAASVTIWWLVVGQLDIFGGRRLLLTVMFGFGSLLWFYGGESGDTWALMHVTAVFGLVIAIYQMLVGRPLTSGLAFGLAVLSRAPVLLALPFFLRMSRIWRFGIGLALLLGLGAYYNYGRFGNPFDNGYSEVVHATTASHFLPWGMFSLRYIPQNARLYFLHLPDNLPSFPWYKPERTGFTIFISTPALYLAMAADYRNKVNLLALAACIAVQTLYLSYYWTGYAQFGCRYTLDYLPFMNVLAADGSKHRSVKSLALLTGAGCLVEVWGIAWWRYKGW